MVATVALWWGTLAPPPRPKRVGELSDCEDTLPGETLDLLLPHPSEEADIVLLNRLVVATLPELADLAVRVQDQSGSRTGTCHLLDLLKEPIGFPNIRAEPDLRGLALSPVPDYSVGRRPPLN